MKIAIDISQIVYGTGVSSYTKNLVEAILRIDSKNEYFLYGGVLRKALEMNVFLKNLKGNFTAKIVPLPPTVADFMWNKMHIFSIDKLIGQSDVFHSSDWVQPPTKAKKVTTVHDLSPLKFPEETNPKVLAAHKRRLQWVKKEVDRIIAVSESTKNDLVDLLEIPSERIDVIYEAPGKVFHKYQDEEVSLVKKRYRIFGKYMLVVGLDPRKNLKRIIAAYDGVRAKEEVKLVLVGKLSQEVGMKRGVLYLGHVPVKDLAVLYSGAEALVYPSLYEGFGLPILEAFSSGCPVITSNISATKEIAQDAAILVDPESADEIEAAMLRVLKNKRVYIEKGFARSKLFSWEKAARETVSLYERLI